MFKIKNSMYKIQEKMLIILIFKLIQIVNKAILLIIKRK